MKIKSAQIDGLARAIHEAAQLEHGLGLTALLATFHDLAEGVADTLGVSRADFVRRCALPEWSRV